MLYNIPHCIFSTFVEDLKVMHKCKKELISTKIHGKASTKNSYFPLFSITLKNLRIIENVHTRSDEYMNIVRCLIECDELKKPLKNRTKCSSSICEC